MTEKPPIRGIVLGQASASSLIVEATAAEVAVFSKQDVVAFAKQESGPPCIGQDMMLYDAQGRPVAMIHDLKVWHEKIDITSYGDSTPQFMAGPRHVDIRAVGIGALTFAPEAFAGFGS